MKITRLPRYLKPLVRNKKDEDFLISLLDKRYTELEDARGYVPTKLVAERDLEIVHAYYFEKISSREIGRQFVVSGARVRSITEKWHNGLHDPEVLRKMQERKGLLKEDKLRAWNKRVAETTEITGD